MQLDSVEAFEIEDYSTASDWEKFINALESFLRRDAPQPTTIQFQRKRYEVGMVGQSVNGDATKGMFLGGGFPENEVQLHPLQLGFGVSRLLLLRSLQDRAEDLSEATLLLSSLSMAAHNCAFLDVPLVVPVGDRHEANALGYATCQGSVYSFSSILKRRDESEASLASIVQRWTDKLNRIPRIPTTGIHLNHQIFARMTFKLTTSYSWKPDNLGKGLVHTECAFGPDADPISSLFVTAHGELATGRVMVNARNLPDWKMTLDLARSPRCPLSSYMLQLVGIMGEADGYASVKSIPISSAELIPTATKRPIFKTVSVLTKKLLEPSDLPTAEEVNAMMTEIYRVNHPLLKHLEFLDPQDVIDVKSAPPLSLLASFSMYCLNLESLPAAALIWTEFVKELRWHWDHFVTVPRTPFEKVHLGQSVLFQKLQLLNHCISKRQEHNQAAGGATVLADTDSDERAYAITDSGWDVDSEGFESVSSEGGTKEEEEEEENQVGDEKSEGREDMSDKARWECGGLRPTEMKLLETGETLWIPITQDSSFMTEDMMMEQQEVLLSLGDDAEGRQLRAEMQSRGLFSDMEAFKACNEGATLIDFCRWHSPNDYTDGKLSSRISGIWRTRWEEAKPKPVSKQKPLLDYVMEGEKALHYLETIDPFLMLRCCTLSALTAAHYSFGKLPAADVPCVSRELAALAAKLIDLGSDDDLGPEDFADACRSLQTVETLVSRATSLMTKLGGDYVLVNRLLTEDGPCDLEEGKDAVVRMLEGAEMGVLPEPMLTEYIINTMRGEKLNRVYARLNTRSHREAHAMCIEL